MSILVVDSETTGMCRWDRQASQHELQPHVVELAATHCDDDGRVQREYASVIAPARWYAVMPPDAEAVHGISYEQACDEGQPLGLVMGEFIELWRACDKLVAFSRGFDLKMLRTSLHRLDKPSLAEDLRNFPCDDPMWMARKPVGALGKNGKVKVPSLAECMAHFFPDEEWAEAHRALPDARAALRVWLACQPKAEPVAGKKGGLFDDAA